MTNTAITTEVFLSHAATERAVAEQVKRALLAAGLSVFDSWDGVAPGERFSDAIWQSLAKCDAFVAVVGENALKSSLLGVELGAAMAWRKPIYLVYTGDSASRLPSYLQDYRVFPLSRVDDVASAIHHGLEPLSEDQLQSLREIYQEFGVPTDRLLQEPATLNELAAEYNRRSGASYSGERLVSDLIRLRKRGELPRLGRA